MQKIVIDTNIIVSSLIQHGYSYLIINNLFIDQKIQVCISDELLAEYFDVLSRPRFSKFQDFFVRAEILLADIAGKAAKYIPTTKIDLISDKDDNMILELADECKADFIIAGNTTDFTFSEYKKTKIVTPREYWEKYKPD
jgi:uncharacterized protein